MVSRVKLLLTPLPLHDFMTYWAAGRLFLSGGDPYSIGAAFAVERSLGWPYVQPLVMLNPPWTLPLVALLGLLPFPVAHYGWLALSLGIEVVCALALWRYFGGENRLRWIALVVLATFLPAASAEHFGQVTPLILGGITGLLFALRRRKYALAGVCLVILGLKPHLVYLVLAAVLLWSMREKTWRVPVTAALGAGGVTLGAIGYNDAVLGYFRASLPAALETNCGVGSALRSVFGLEHVWLQFVPCVAGSLWFARYWMRHHRDWKWEERMPLLLLVSIGSAAYFWMQDYILALPAVIALAVQVGRAKAWPVAAILYVVVQTIIVNSDSTSAACTASLLWIMLYWVVGLLEVARPPVEGAVETA